MEGSWENMNEQNQDLMVLSDSQDGRPLLQTKILGQSYAMCYQEPLIVGRLVNLKPDWGPQHLWHVTDDRHLTGVGHCKVPKIFAYQISGLYLKRFLSYWSSKVPVRHTDTSTVRGGQGTPGPKFNRYPWNMAV